MQYCVSVRNWNNEPGIDYWFDEFEEALSMGAHNSNRYEVVISRRDGSVVSQVVAFRTIRNK